MFLDVIAIIISVASLCIVLYQTNGLKKTLENQIYENCISNSLEIDRLLIEYPDMRKYVYYKEEIDENDPNLDRILSIEEFIVDAVENIEVYKQYIPKDRRDGWVEFAREMKNTPAYRYYITMHEGMHGKWFEVKK